MKRFLMIAALLLGVMGMAFSKAHFYNYNTIKEFEEDWTKAENKYPFVFIALVPDGDVLGDLVVDAFLDDIDIDALDFVYGGKKDVEAVFCFPDEKDDIEWLLIEEVKCTNQKWFSLPNQKEEARKYWNALVEAEKVPLPLLHVR